MLDKNTTDLIDIFLLIKPRLQKKEAEHINASKEIQKFISSSIINQIILSRKLFKRNIMVAEFLEKKFSIELKKYMLSSRTIICGKVTKHIYNITDGDELATILNILYGILKKIRDDNNIIDSDIYEVIMEMKL